MVGSTEWTIGIGAVDKRVLNRFLDAGGTLGRFRDLKEDKFSSSFISDFNLLISKCWSRDFKEHAGLLIHLNLLNRVRNSSNPPEPKFSRRIIFSSFTLSPLRFAFVTHDETRSSHLNQLKIYGFQFDLIK